MYVVANHTTPKKNVNDSGKAVQLSLFDAAPAVIREDVKEKKIQQSILSLQRRYGKNAVLKGMNLKEGATAIERNGQIGGHRA